MPCIKISNQTEKITNPGIKNIMRFYRDGSMLCDLLYLEDEEKNLLEKTDMREPVRFNHPATDYAGFTLKAYDAARPLLTKVMEKGRRIAPSASLQDIREHRKLELSSLDKTYRRLLNPHTYKVSLSDNLKSLKTKLIKEIVNISSD